MLVVVVLVVVVLVVVVVVDVEVVVLREKKSDFKYLDGKGLFPPC